MEITTISWGCAGIMKKQTGNFYSMFGLYRDNGKNMETPIKGLGFRLRV